MTEQSNRHYSAFKGEITKHLSLKSGDLFVDLTLGDGGHTQEALEAGCKVISFDVDPQSIERATFFLKDIAKPQLLTSDSKPDTLFKNSNWVIINTNFINFLSEINKHSIKAVNKILVDLGPSQNQVLNENRGFSFNSNALLDMRIDPTLSVTAKDLINVLNEGELRELFLLADETYAKPLAKSIVNFRKTAPITTCKQLATLISSVKHSAVGKIHPATKVFMSLRMAVNSERENIKQLLQLIPQALAADGVAGIITFHSTEDRVVKESIKDLTQKNLVFAINKKPIEPSIEELKNSMRTRSAKLRLIKKC
ncbi:16S rRNA (cytosine(1402)-N(4))-methyltransferase [Candidatus Collierbacteria bacterium RIFOXYD1_FULL_40_9]|uniref:Ribosomal RNA small subunit methyltransferase H n=1 Tax=Candidatus Collierbacteria bacterium RIFOXYD1_FULL_40_9 TaxID=1817731 RepID=A0A1F5FVL1_9BACT|nr:MAG: 16S rRNA (cytosine(1402)-N(4))-methyltransferase [Candidatus Collierbacteria bacterium RIFOXYD1_FULL_40_9]